MQEGKSIGRPRKNRAGLIGRACRRAIETGRLGQGIAEIAAQEGNYRKIYMKIGRGSFY